MGDEITACILTVRFLRKIKLVRVSKHPNLWLHELFRASHSHNSTSIRILAGLSPHYILIEVRVIKSFLHRHASMSWTQTFDTVTKIHRFHIETRVPDKMYLTGKPGDVLHPFRACTEVVLYEELSLIIEVSLLIGNCSVPDQLRMQNP